MEFLKKNWSKLVISVLMFLAGLVYVIALFTTDATIKVFETHAAIAAAIVFFWGCVAYYVAKMLDQKWAKYVLLGVGVVATVFACAYLIYELDIWSDIPSKIGGVSNPYKPSMFEYLAGTHAFTFLIVFGLIPLVKGVKKILCCCCSEKKEKAAPAPASKAASAPAPAPKTAPAPAAKAPASKAPAKK